MSDQTKTEIPKFICCSVAVIDTETGDGGTMPSRFEAFLCPHCDNTHFQLRLADGTTIQTSWPPHIAETMARMLINPYPADIDNIHKTKKH